MPIDMVTSLNIFWLEVKDTFNLTGGVPAGMMLPSEAGSPNPSSISEDMGASHCMEAAARAASSAAEGSPSSAIAGRFADFEFI